jgi:hypothetical protein
MRAYDNDVLGHHNRRIFIDTSAVHCFGLRDSAEKSLYSAKASLLAIIVLADTFVISRGHSTQQ